jgi:hypothetical protein
MIAAISSDHGVSLCDKKVMGFTLGTSTPRSLKSLFLLRQQFIKSCLVRGKINCLVAISDDLDFFDFIAVTDCIHDILA